MLWVTKRNAHIWCTFLRNSSHYNAVLYVYVCWDQYWIGWRWTSIWRIIIYYGKTRPQHIGLLYWPDPNAWISCIYSSLAWLRMCIFPILIHIFIRFVSQASYYKLLYQGIIQIHPSWRMTNNWNVVWHGRITFHKMNTNQSLSEMGKAEKWRLVDSWKCFNDNRSRSYHT